MAELILIRHAQASFGAADYDVLSERGHRQARALGLALKAHGTRPDAVFTGTQRRHRETLAGLAEELVLPAASAHPGLDEFDAGALLLAHNDGAVPDDLHSDRRVFFRALRDAVVAWQAGGLAAAPETYAAFRARVAEAWTSVNRRGGPPSWR